jgi:hypothetical protein
MFGFRGIVWIAPKWIVIANSMGIVTNVVTCRFIAPGLSGRADFDADATTQVIQSLLGNFRKASLTYSG